MSEDEENFDPLAQLDQMLAAGRDIAMLVARYHAALVENELDDEAALELTLAYQSGILSAGRSDD